MNYPKLSKLFLILGMLDFFLILNPPNLLSGKRMLQRPLVQVDIPDMSNASVGADHSQPFSIVSDATNPHKACLETPEGYEITLFKIGMCTKNPFDETNDNVDLAFY